MGLFYKDDNESMGGFALAEVLIAVAILMFATSGITVLVSNSSKGAKGISDRTDVESARLAVIKSVNCDETLRGLDLRASCSSDSATQNPPYLALRRKTVAGDQSITDGAQRGDGSYLFGQYLLRTTCSWSEQSLVIKAVPLNLAAKDPNIWNSAKPVLLFGKGASLPLCFNEATVGSTAQYILNQDGDIFKIYGPDNAARRFAGPEDQPGISCNIEEGWRLTGCYKTSGNASEPEDLKVSAEYDGCYTERTLKKTTSRGVRRVMEFELTGLCLKRF
jgi:hypothetical protein